MKIIAVNKSASFEYFIEEKYEAGIVLDGNEVKSLRLGNVNMNDSFCFVVSGEAFVKNMHIAFYEKTDGFTSKNTRRDRKLLLHKREIMRLLGLVKQQGLTLVPLSLYFKGSIVKVQLGLCKGKQLHDKRAVAAKRDANRAIDRALKEQNR